MLTDEERIKIYGSAERVADVDRVIAASVEAMPELTEGQRARLRVLLGDREPLEGVAHVVEEPAVMV